MLVFLMILFLLIGSIGGIFVNSSINTWYAFLNKPFFNPPSFIFAPVWSVLYILLAVYYWRLSKIYDKSEHKKQIKNLKKIFIIQLLLNFSWTPVFFGLRNILGGLIILTIIDLLVIEMAVKTLKIDKKCFYISLLYLSWLIYATILNISIFVLN